MKKLVLCILFVLMLSGCYDETDINEFAFVVAIGIDKGGNDYNIYTIQIANPLIFAGKGGGDNEGQESGGDSEYNNKSKNKALENITVKAPNLYTAMDIANSSFSKKYNFTHTKLIVFSEEFARESIEGQMSTFLYSTDFDANLHVAVSNSTAIKYLANINPPIEINPVRYYNNIFEKNNSLYSPNTHLSDFNINPSYNINAVVSPLVGVSNVKNAKDLSSDYGYGIHPTIDYLPGTNIKQSKINSDIIGMAIFKNNKMIDKTSGEEALLYRIIMNKVNNVNYSVKLDPQKNFVIRLDQVSNAKKSISFDKYKAKIKINITLIGDIVWSGSINNIYDMESTVKNELAKQLEEFLYKCSKSYKADIFNFGSIAKKNYLTVNAWQNEDWQYLYENAEFEVNVDLNIERAQR